MGASINEHILEVRYKPNPKILDYRGTWAETLSELMGLSKWRISGNRIDVHDPDRERQAFVSYKNAGFIVRSMPTRDYFQNQSLKHLHFLMQQKAFGDPIFVRRIGVRLRSAKEFKGTFEELLRKYTANYLTLSEQGAAAFDGDLIDIGGPINFETSIGKIHSMSGPMGAEQVREYLSFAEYPPSVSFYLDLDYWDRPEREMTYRDLQRRVREYMEHLWKVTDTIEALVGVK